MTHGQNGTSGAIAGVPVDHVSPTEPDMNGATMVALTVLSASAAFAETDNFDRYARGTAPEGWTCSVTGKGTPKWTVDADPSAPSAPNVLRQSASGTSRGA